MFRKCGKGKQCFYTRKCLACILQSPSISIFSHPRLLPQFIIVLLQTYTLTCLYHTLCSITPQCPHTLMIHLTVWRMDINECDTEVRRVFGYRDRPSSCTSASSMSACLGQPAGGTGVTWSKVKSLQSGARQLTGAAVSVGQTLLGQASNFSVGQESHPDWIAGLRIHAYANKYLLFSVI